MGKQWADGWDCSNGKLPAAAAQGKRADQHRADNQQRHHGGKDIYHAGGAGKGKQRNQKAERRTAPKGGGQYLRSAPTPAAMMTNIPKRKNSCSSPTASRRSGIGRRIGLGHSRCAAPAAAIPQRKRRVPPPAAGPLSPANQSSQKTATAPGRRHSPPPGNSPQM